MDHDDRVNNNKDNDCERTTSSRGATTGASQVPAQTSSPGAKRSPPSFWRTNSRALPGRPSLASAPIPAMAHNNKQVGSSFQNYQESVSDAWDLGDDEFCIISGLSDTKISRRVSQSAAMNVIKTHRSSLSNATASGGQSAAASAINNNNNHSSPTSTGAVAVAASDSSAEGSSHSHNNNHYATESSSSSNTTSGTNNQSLTNSSQDTANENNPETK